MQVKVEPGEAVEIEADWLHVTDFRVMLDDGRPNQQADVHDEIVECFGEGKHFGPWKITVQRAGA